MGFISIKNNILKIYHESSFWIKLILASEIIITLISSKCDSNLFPFYFSMFWYAAGIFFFLGAIGGIEFVYRIAIKRDQAIYEVREFPDYILEIAQDFGLKDIKFHLLNGVNNIWYDSKKKVFLIGEIAWNLLTSEEKIAVMAHEFTHTKKLIEYLVIFVCSIEYIIIYYVMCPSHNTIIKLVEGNIIKYIALYFVSAFSVFYVCCIVLWMRELNADRYSLNYSTIEIFQSGLSKIIPLSNCFTFTHPSENFRIWFLQQYNKYMRGQSKL